MDAFERQMRPFKQIWDEFNPKSLKEKNFKQTQDQVVKSVHYESYVGEQDGDLVEVTIKRTKKPKVTLQKKLRELEKQKQIAVQNENYEEAAKLHKEIQRLHFENERSV